MTAFWILTTAILSLALALASIALGLRASWAWGAVGLCIVLPGLAWPPWFEIGIRAWNKGVRLSAAVFRAYVLKVCYCLLFGAVSRAGSSLDVVRRDTDVSKWIPRASQERFDRTLRFAGSGRSNHGLLALARTSGNGWMVCLLPTVLLLQLLWDEQTESAVPSSTYTLY